MLFPYAPSYREAIYKLMDKEFDIDWFFCRNATRNLKLLDYTELINCDLSMEEKKIYGSVVYYKGITKLNLSQYDVIICAGVIRSISEWWLLQKIGRGMKHPRIYLWTHGWYGKESRLQKLIKKFFFRKVDGFFLYGDYARNEMIKEGFDADKLHVIKNSLDYDRQLAIRRILKPTMLYNEHFGYNYPVLIMIGRLNIRKKLDMLIEAVNVLKSQGENYNIVFIGEGEDRIKLSSLVTKYGITERAWFYGACYDERTNAELLYNADLCVIPGDIGLTAIHAMTMGIPVISHNCFKYQGPEFESIIPGRTGDFFEYDNVDDLAHCISQWFATKRNAREQVRQACYAEIDKHWNPYYQLKVLKSVFEAKCNYHNMVSDI